MANNINTIQITDDELSAIFHILDATRNHFPKDSPYYNDVRSVDNFLNRGGQVVNLVEIMKLSRKLLEDGQLSNDGFVQIRSLVGDMCSQLDNV